MFCLHRIKTKSNHINNPKIKIDEKKNLRNDRPSKPFRHLLWVHLFSVAPFLIILASLVSFPPEQTQPKSLKNKQQKSGKC